MGSGNTISSLSDKFKASAEKSYSIATSRSFLIFTAGAGLCTLPFGGAAGAIPFFAAPAAYAGFGAVSEAIAFSLARLGPKPPLLWRPMQQVGPGPEPRPRRPEDGNSPPNCQP